MTNPLPVGSHLKANETPDAAAGVLVHYQVAKKKGFLAEEKKQLI